MRVRKTREDWEEIVEEFERSNQRPRDFCSGRGLTTTSLSWWRWKLGRSRRRSETEQVRFVPVQVVGPPPVASDLPHIAIMVAGVEVRVGPGADVSYVVSLLTELRSRC